MTNVGFNIKTIKGSEGAVRMPDAGILVGWFSDWTLTKEKDLGSTYTLKATFGYVNPTLWKNEDYAKEITVKLSKAISYRLCGGEPAELNDKHLVQRGVELCKPEPADSEQ